jgi:hypothetical protein
LECHRSCGGKIEAELWKEQWNIDVSGERNFEAIALGRGVYAASAFAPWRFKIIQVFLAGHDEAG